MKDFSEVNFFTDPGLVANPYPYYEYLRAQCPVVHVPSSGVVAVTGYDELNQVYRDSATFSAVNSSLGPFPLPFEVAGDDISEQVEAHRDQFPMSEHLVSFDPPKHTAHRALLNGLFTPKRLKENEEFMWRLADQLIDEFATDGRAEFASAYGQPFPLLVIADLLGVPEADHSMFRELLAGRGPAEDPEWAQRGDDGSVNMNPLAYLDKWFTSLHQRPAQHARRRHSHRDGHPTLSGWLIARGGGSGAHRHIPVHRGPRNDRPVTVQRDARLGGGSRPAEYVARQP